MEISRPCTTNPDWVIHHPLKEHQQTFIFLHGRGDRADSFGPDFYTEPLPDGTTLGAKFPNAKWIFPQAPLSKLAIDPTWKFYQWFDVWGLRPGQEEQDLQIAGLQDTTKLIHNILKQEIEAVGAENVVLGGLSQGCASSLVALMLWEGQPFAACVGLCGWLPFRKLIQDATQHSELVTDDTGPQNVSSTQRAVSVLRNKLGLPAISNISSPFEKVPVFLGHGTEDEVVVTTLGEEAAVCLGRAGMKVEYKTYEGLQHWYCGPMLQDAAHFMESSGVVPEND